MKIARIAALLLLVVSVTGCASGSSEEAERWVARFSAKCAESFSESDCTELRREIEEDGTWDSKAVDQVLCEHQQRQSAYWFHFNNQTEEQIAAFCDPSNPIWGPSGS